MQLKSTLKKIFFYQDLSFVWGFLIGWKWVWIFFQVHLRSAERLRDLCCANRGTFIKVGQHLGALDYLLPEEYTTTLKVLHSKAPESTMEEIQQVVREDLGKEVSHSVLGLQSEDQTLLSICGLREQNIYYVENSIA